MKNDKENEKKGFFGRLTENKKSKKGSCCCNIKLEEIVENEKQATTENTDKDKD
ncbi:MAG: hypothetical protein AB9844_06780 [Clostridiaceae bacterium]